MSVEKRRPTAGQQAAILPPEEVLFGRSEAMKQVRRRAAKIAGTGIPVLLYGPKGSGKEVLARWLHSHSAVSNGQRPHGNSGALPRPHLESEPFRVRTTRLNLGAAS